MGYSRAGFLSLLRAFLPRTFSDSASAGSTCFAIKRVVLQSRLDFLLTDLLLLF
jgi:hypothetical protein